MNEDKFRSIYLELIEENPFAVRTVLQVLEVDFTDEVPTLAVTCTEQPVLKVNIEFVAETCRTEREVKALIVHEFLHVLLRHTTSKREFTPARHLATDAVINAIIHRQLGDAYSNLMARYYRHEKGVRRLLRRPRDSERWAVWKVSEQFIRDAWLGLYLGQLCADDIEEIAKDLEASGQRLSDNLLGGHEEGAWIDEADHSGEPAWQSVEEALDRALETMNGDGIWRSPHGRGIAAHAYRNETRQADQAVERWCRATFAVLKRHVDPAANGAIREDRPLEYLLPVLSSRDRRAVLRSLWSPFLPEARWDSVKHEAIGGTQVYLDVSGSMNAEMPLIVKLLGRLGCFIQRPFWAFSNVVAPAVIRNGKLCAGTTGGTSMACVLEHVVRTRPPAAVVVTDGYIEALPPDLVREAAGTRLHTIVTRDGSTALLERAGIPCTQLGRIPQ
jgi:hypothetical protein